MTAVVTGATGYLGSHIARAFVDAGLQVRGVARSQAKANAWKQYNANIDVDFVIVPALETPGSLKAALQDATIIAHCAAGLPDDIADKQRAVDSMIDGTLKVMRAAASTPSIEHVVLISTAPLVDMTPYEGRTRKLEAEMDDMDAYSESTSSLPSERKVLGKALSEQAAWNFIKTESPHFALTSILPSFVLGPRAHPVDEKTMYRGTILFERFINDPMLRYSQCYDLIRRTYPKLDLPKLEVIKPGDDIPDSSLTISTLSLRPRAIDETLRDTVDDILGSARLNS